MKRKLNILLIPRSIAIALSVLALAMSACHEHTEGNVIDGILHDADSLFLASDAQQAIKLQRQAASAAYSDVERQRANIELAQSYYFTGKIDSTIALVTECINYFDTIGDVTQASLRLQMTAISLYADILRANDEYPECNEYYRRSANIAYLLRLDEDYVKNMLYIYKYCESSGDYFEAIDGYNELFAICSREGLLGLKNNIHNSLISTYLAISDTEKADELLEELKKEVDESDPLISTMITLDRMQIALATNNVEAQDSAYYHLQELIADELVEEYYGYEIYKQIAEYFLKHDEPNMAYDSILQLIREDEKYNTPDQREYLEILKADYFVSSGLTDMAIRSLKKVDSENLRTKNIALYNRYLDLCSRAYYKKQNYRGAYNMLIRQTQISDNLKKESIGHDFAYKTLIYKRDTTIIGQRFRISQQEDAMEEMSLWQRFWIFISISLLLGSLLLFSYMRMVSIRKREQEILSNNERLQLEVNRQTSILKSQEIELKNKQNSMATEVYYAGQIQRSMLPLKESFYSPFLGDLFILYKPCSTVSGDFYWCGTKGSKFFVVVGDATGHGIPGALIAMVCTTILNDLQSDGKDITTVDLLNSIDVDIRKILRRNENIRANDSVDMSILMIDNETGKASVGLARHNAYLVHAADKSIERLMGAKRSIGEEQDSFAVRQFEEIPIDIADGDMLYMLSDGYESQLGGPENKKFKRQHMTNLFVEIADKKGSEQQETLNTTIIQWRGSEEQTDDILIIGLKFKVDEGTKNTPKT